MELMSRITKTYLQSYTKMLLILQVLTPLHQSSVKISLTRVMWVLYKETDSAHILFKVCDIHINTNSTLVAWPLSTWKAMKLESTCSPFQVRCRTVCFCNASLLFTHHAP